MKHLKFLGKYRKELERVTQQEDKRLKNKKEAGILLIAGFIDSQVEKLAEEGHVDRYCDYSSCRSLGHVHKDKLPELIRQIEKEYEVKLLDRDWKRCWTDLLAEEIYKLLPYRATDLQERNKRIAGVSQKYVNNLARTLRDCGSHYSDFLCQWVFHSFKIRKNQKSRREQIRQAYDGYRSVDDGCRAVARILLSVESS